MCVVVVSAGEFIVVGPLTYTVAAGKGVTVTTSFYRPPPFGSVHADAQLFRLYAELPFAGVKFSNGSANHRRQPSQEYCEKDCGEYEIALYCQDDHE